jgi:hypothetical protein
VGPLGQHPDRGEIINSRHSEALVPGVLTLDHLRWVVCRSAPERSTLLHLLSPQARERWRPRVILEGPRVIFYKRATFVTEAVLAHDKTRASFFTQTLGPEWRGPFAAHATWSVGGVPKWTAEDATFTAPATPYVWRLPESLEQYEFRLTLDGHLVYFGSFPEDTGPSVL